MVNKFLNECFPNFFNEFSNSFEMGKKFMETLKKEKPNDQSILDNHYSIVISDFEMTLEYMEKYLIENDF